MQKHHIFLCHANKDKPFVRKLAKDLEVVSIHAWFDEWELAPGDSLHAKIGDALEDACYVAVIVSPDSMNSHWVKKELEQALSRESRTGEKVVIPLRYRRSPMPPFLEDKSYLDFSKSYYAGIVRLAALIHRLDQRTVAKLLSEGPVKSIDQAKDILARGGWRRPMIFDHHLYSGLLELLRKQGVSTLPDLFEIGAKDKNGKFIMEGSMSNNVPK